MDKAEKMWANTTVLVEAGYPEGHFEDLNRLCKLEGYALAAKKVKFVKIERTDVKLFDEIGSMEILCATLRNFMGRRLKLLFMGNEDGEVLLDVDVHSELYNNCHYNASCVSTAVKSPVYELDAPMVLQPRPKKGEIDETTGEPELIAVDPETTSLREILSKFTLSPSPSGTTRFLVQAVLTGGGSRVLLTYVKTEEHKAVIKLLVENAPGYIFFELIKKYEVLPVYAALLTWFGKAPVTASLNRTSHDGASIVTNDSRSSRADTQSEFAFLLDQGIQNVMQNDERLMEFDPDTNSLGTVLPLGQEYWSGDQLPFKLNTLASDIVEDARAANANVDDATHDGRKRDRSDGSEKGEDSDTDMQQ
ncbi:hypothetical protein THAOC_20228 [Thalassiosira oceanica]|uniref:Uncharacterized protein n=1 Tax=Thalassiosira oceanica TaxID=159749 RepID=K0SF04_THAOC|nr:hypothetical protein THAOC_20228 [Thalassiosira oceanica]|eukprot:EJK59536.1 hypothetical protein THAOC_20228 [Thalassiosira oceanica]